MTETTARWLEPLYLWPSAAASMLERDGTVIRVVVAEVRGSAPREVGAGMLISQHSTLGTIGGGELEHRAVEHATQMLMDTALPDIELLRYVLATDLAQCCGGVVRIWFEKLIAADVPFLRSAERASMTGVSSVGVTYAEGRIERRIVPQHIAAHVEHLDDTLRWFEPLRDPRPEVRIFGAGHVGQALVRVFDTLPARVSWIDPRSDLLPGTLRHVQCRPMDDPVVAVRDAPRQSHFIVMTHRHALDYDLCRAVLARDDAAFLGLIGSASKAARFRSRLLRDGVSSTSLARLTCPIGLSGLHSKDPAVIAIAIAAQWLQHIESVSVVPSRAPAGAIEACTNERCAGCNSSRIAS